MGIGLAELVRSGLRTSSFLFNQVRKLDALENDFRSRLAENPDDLIAKHWLAAIAHHSQRSSEAVELLKQALIKDVCHPDGPIDVFERLVSMLGEEAAASYLSWYMAERENFIFGQIDDYVKWLRTSRYVDSPLIVQIETLTLCNAACTFCQYPDLTRKGDRMSDEMVNKIIDEIAMLPHDLPLTVTLYGVSEPFLDKRIFDHIELLNEKAPHAQIGLNTNGAPLNAANIARLAKLKVAWMGISVNDYRKAEYEETMKISFDRTLRVLDTLQKMRASGEIPFNVGVTRAGDGSIHDLRFIKWVRTNYSALTNYFTPHFVWVGDNPGAAILAPQVGCTHWFELAIRGNGQVSFCGIDGHIAHSRGDVSKSSMLEIYNDPSFRKLRESNVSRVDVEQCRACTSG